MTPLAAFLSFIRRRRLARQAEREERRRAALRDQIAYRRRNHMPLRPHEGMLKDATCRALAASIGQEWIGDRHG